MCDKGFAGAGAEEAAADLGQVLIRPVRQGEPAPQAAVFPAWLRRRVCALNAAIWHNWLIGPPDLRCASGSGWLS